MKKQYTKTPRKPHTKRKRFVAGYGGMVGRGVGYLSKQLTTKGSTANWMLKKVKQLANAVNVEYKIYDFTTASIQPDYNGSITVLNQPAQGTSDIQRIGDSIKNQHLIIRGGITNNVTGTTYTRTRVIVVWDEQNQLSTIADLLEYTGVSYAVLSPKHYDKRFRSNVLYDQLFTTSTYAGSQAFFRDWEINLPIGKHTQFSAGTTTINSGALKLILLSDHAPATTVPNVDFVARLTYTDD